ncbi:MAG: glycerol-3-phosphate acyltransferase [Bacteroidales bacterium]|jgi:glycerol-3-phosphate acyltransferase PlsY|nr:glycerol-3-phosphate acyltransferase [Bacteroidales bacterium]
MSESVMFMNDHQWLTAILCGVTGYLIGSVSFARIVYFLATRKRHIEPFSEPVPHSDETFESDLVSATLVTKKLGKRYGVITSLADMLKVAIPTLLVKLAFPEELYFLLIALFGVAGHNFPVYYRFVGGRGESSILGIILVINWFGLLVANLAATILGFIVGSVLVIRWGGYVILIFWLWYWFDDWRYALFMLLINCLFWISMRKDLSRFIELKKKGLVFSEEDVSEFILMGKSMGRALDRYSLYAIIKRFVSKSGERHRR